MSQLALLAFVVKEEPVSLLRQTIYCLIPVMDIYAAYRVRRLRRYLLLMIIFVGVPLSVLSSVLFDPDEVSAQGFYNFMIFYYGVDEGKFVYSVLSQIGTVLVAIYLIRRWSKQWNAKFG